MFRASLRSGASLLAAVRLPALPRLGVDSLAAAAGLVHPARPQSCRRLHLGCQLGMRLCRCILRCHQFSRIPAELHLIPSSVREGPSLRLTRVGCIPVRCVDHSHPHWRTCTLKHLAFQANPMLCIPVPCWTASDVYHVCLHCSLTHQHSVTNTISSLRAQLRGTSTIPDSPMASSIALQSGVRTQSHIGSSCSRRRHAESDTQPRARHCRWEVQGIMITILFDR